MNLLLVAIALLLIAANAFFAMAEYALVRVRSSRIEELSRLGHRRAKMAQFALLHIDGYLSAIQLGVSMISLGLGWVGEPSVAWYVEKIFPLLPFVVTKTVAYSISLGIAFALITATHITVGELIPKLIAIRVPEKAIFLTIVPLTFFYYVGYYPMLLLQNVSRGVLKLIGIGAHHGESSHSDEEIRILLDRNEEEGRLSLDRLMMFENLFDFGHATVREIMTLRANIAYLSLAKSWKENLALMQSRKYSRLPLCESDLDSVVGYVHVKDLAYALASGEKPTDLRVFSREILRVNETSALEECLSHFQQRRGKIALIENSEHTVIGLATTEDIIEEIVGEIRDEFEGAPTIPLSQTVIAEASLFEISATSRFEAVKQLLKRLQAVMPIFDFNETLNAVYKREQGLPTAVGHQSAFPHARVAGLVRPLVVFGRAPQGIDFKAPGERVKLLFLILSPFNEPTVQLRILSQLARLVSNDTLRERLLDAATVEELMEAITSFEEKIPV